MRSDTFNVGLLIPMSGSLGLLGPSAYACARLARDIWNQGGGVDGREVCLSVFNSSESSMTLESELNLPLCDSELDALITLCNTAVCRRISSVVDARVPLIYTPHFEGTGLPRWVHAIGETPDRQLLPAIDWLARRYRLRRWYLLGNDYSWPRRTHSLGIPFIRASGAEVVGERYVPLGERCYEPIIEDIVRSRADVVLVSLVGGESVYMCRAFGHAGLGAKVLRLSICMEENAVLGAGDENTEGMFVAAGYFANIDSDANGAFKERYRSHFGDRAPMLNSLSQSVYEGFVHLQRQTRETDSGNAGHADVLPGVRDRRRRASDASQNPIFLGAADGLSIRVIESLGSARG
ncbi:MAG: ABC transporter substrate-binding protein [Gammaproteobacteria bacterium]